MLGASKITFQRWGLGVNSEIRENRRRGKEGGRGGERERARGEEGRLEKSNGFWGGKQGRAACSSGYLVTLVGARYLNGHPRFV